MINRPWTQPLAQSREFTLAAAILDPKYDFGLPPLQSGNAGGKQDAKLNAPSPALSERLPSPQDTPTPAQYRSEAFHKPRTSTVTAATTRPGNLTRPTLTSSRSSTLDSSISSPSIDQLGGNHGLGQKYSSGNSSSTSLGKRAVQETSSLENDSPHAMSRVDSQTSYARSQSPPPPLPAQPATAANTSAANSSSHLSGLVCNVHRTTGREPHSLVGATTTILGDKLYVFGGRRISRSRPTLTSDLYELDLLRRHWSKIEIKGDIPQPRYFHTMCALGDSKLVCYGGMSSELPATANSESPEAQVSVMSDVHIYDTATQTWHKVHTPGPDSPPGRYAHCATVLPSSAVFASASAPKSALHNNASGDSANSGSIGISIDGTGGAEMIVIGGQDSANKYIEQISVFNLRSLKWTSTTPSPWRSCGAYRSVVLPLTSMKSSQVGVGPGKPSVEESEPDNASHSGSPAIVYTNYNFLDVKLQLQIRQVDGTVIDKPMQTAVSPPGLRFPSGGIIDHHFVVSGTFLTSSRQEFALWALDLKTLTWAKIDVASGIFSSGSWNRGILWSRRNAFVILGNRKRNLVDDYSSRRLNFTNMCLVQLEAFGLYDNPRKMTPTSDFQSVSAPLGGQIPQGVYRGGVPLRPVASRLGEVAMDARELADMEILALDGTRIPINSRVVGRRWGSSFNTLMQDANPALSSGDTQTLRPSAASIISRNSSVTITPSVQTVFSSGSTLVPPGRSSIVGDEPLPGPADAADLQTYRASSRPRIIYLPHTVPTITALLHFLYTSSLPPISSPLATPQILCSLLQLARPYQVDGLIEAVVERLHEGLDGRNAAAIFNAAAMGAGGGNGIDLAGTDQPAHPPRTASLVGMHMEALKIESATTDKNSLRIDTSVANGMSRPSPTRNMSIDGGTTTEEEDDDGGPRPESARSNSSLASQMSRDRPGSRGRGDEVWNGGWSAVIGLQKRGLRGLMEGRRLRERGKGPEGGGQQDGGGQRVGLGIA